MIVPMNKMTALIFHRDKNVFLSRLQEVGVVHINVRAADGENEALRGLERKIRRCETVLKAAERDNPVQYRKNLTREIPDHERFLLDDTFLYVESFEAIWDELAKIDDAADKLEREIRNLDPWGDYTVDTIRKLQDAGVNLRFFIAPVRTFDQLNVSGRYITEVSRDRTYVYFVAAAFGEPVPDMGCDEFHLPEQDKRTLSSDYQALMQRRRKKIETLQGIYSLSGQIREYADQARTELSYLLVRENITTVADNTVSVVTGWIPHFERSRIENFLETEEVYYEFSTPGPEDDVPVLLRNNRFSRLFEPITRLFALPRYAELDLTVFFAPFFALFFGFCLGDAGYGVVLIIAAAFAFRKAPPSLKPLTVLLAILGVATMGIGILTGTIFGFDLLKLDAAWVSGLKQAVVFTPDRLFFTALILGVIQVELGMFVKALNRIRQYGIVAALSTIGWMLLMFGMVFLVAPMLAPQLRAPGWAAWFCYAGTALILLFNDVRANIFVRFGKGLWELYGITGVFGDILSYIRLFALGISSAILGLVVNEIAWECRAIPLIGWAVMVLVMVLGHTGNLLLGALSSFVHPLRLTFVEFYKSAGFEGGGKEYSPFRKIQASQLR